MCFSDSNIPYPEHDRLAIEKKILIFVQIIAVYVNIN